jgi:4'-phosphopantetheinyl transferase
MKLWYLNIEKLTDTDYACALNDFPPQMVKEMEQYKLISDRKGKAFARLLVKKYFKESRQGNWNWNSWKKSDFAKPFICNGPEFSISHSGSYVVVGFSETSPLGVDIEKIVDADLKALSSYFHRKEITYLQQKGYSKELFYKIWSRKEALFKAIGIGIVQGLDMVSVLENKINYKGTWILQDVENIPGYSVAVCVQENDTHIEVKEVTAEEVIEPTVFCTYFSP